MPCCPFCGIGLGYIEAFIVKNKSIYKCLNCGKPSEIILENSIYKLTWFTQTTAIVIFAVAIFLKGIYALAGLILNLILFGGFYMLSPYMFSLEEPKYLYIRRKAPWYKRLLNITRSKRKETKGDPLKKKKLNKENITNNMKRDIKNINIDIDDRDIFSN